MRLGGGGTEIKRPVLSSVSFQLSERQGMQSGNREAAGGACSPDTQGKLSWRNLVWEDGCK